MSSAKAEARELAYRVWRECGQNLSEAERRLAGRENGLPVSRQTLTDWAKKYDWQGRAAREDVVKEEIVAGAGDDGLLTSLLVQKGRYEKYFEELPPGKIDNQAMYAYSGVLKTIVNLREKQAQEQPEAQVDRPRYFVEDVQFIATVLKEIDPQGMKIFARNIDAIVARFKEAQRNGNASQA